MLIKTQVSTNHHP
ncbi:hypothetical protein QLX08_008383 [Tetragonisca angustula]|uniref:Uncharacterized protein n=1 Tax=Tetragonisca angustula TaxID=166442 RepID=A0AAW0ZMI5_9HYME